MTKSKTQNFSNKSGQILKDTTKTGKDRHWQERKLKSIELAERLEELGLKGFERVYQCAEVLKFYQRDDGTLKLHQAWFCKNRQCPICNWRRSMKYSAQLSKIVDKAIQRQPKAKFLFLTLTIKNCGGEELDNEIKKMHKRFRHLMHYAKVEKNLLGFVRATETSYNDELGNYHPHMHVLLMVKSTYFSGHGDNYISQEEWVKLWQKAMQLDYLPSVDIRKVYDRKGKGMVSAIQETAKYPVKPIEIDVKDNDELLQVTYDLYHGLRRKRLLSFGGLFKEIKNELGLDDIEDGDLVDTNDDEEEATTGEEIVAQWCWERSNYFIK